MEENPPMKFKVTPSLNDGKNDAPPMEFEVHDTPAGFADVNDWDKMMAHIEDEFVNDEGEFFGVGFTVTIERIA